MKPRLRLFTLEEANQLIPEVSQRLDHLLEKKEKYTLRHDMVFMHELLTEAEQSGGVSGDTLAPALESDALGLEEDLQDLEREMAKIRALGCALHDLESGYVDFPSERNGQVVLLCWKRGEPAIAFYHSRQTRVEDRLPLS